MASNRRLTKELGELEADPIEGISAAPEGDDLYSWRAMMEGPAGTPYEGGLFELVIAFPREYPFRAPKVTFATQIYHPNIKQDTGEICADVVANTFILSCVPLTPVTDYFCQNWAPTLNLRYVLNRIKQLLEEPNADSPLEAEIANLFSSDRDAFNTAARDHTARFAGV